MISMIQSELSNKAVKFNIISNVNSMWINVTCVLISTASGRYAMHMLLQRICANDDVAILAAL